MVHFDKLGREIRPGDFCIVEMGTIGSNAAIALSLVDSAICFLYIDSAGISRHLSFVADFRTKIPTESVREGLRKALLAEYGRLAQN